MINTRETVVRAVTARFGKISADATIANSVGAPNARIAHEEREMFVSSVPQTARFRALPFVAHRIAADGPRASPHATEIPTADPSIQRNATDRRARHKAT